MRRSYLKILLFVVYLLSTSARVSAQDGLLYYMKNTPHSYRLNPASQPNYYVFIGVPILSSNNLKFRSSSLALSDLVVYNKDIDAPVLPLYSKETKKNFLNHFSKVNDFAGSFEASLFSFGGKMDRAYLIFDASLVANSRVTYPGNMIEFLLNGNSGGAEISLNKLNFSSTMYLQTGLVFSKQVNDKLTVGIHPKYLNGLFTFYNLRNKSDLFIDAKVAEIKVKNQFRIGLPEIVGLENYLTDSLLFSQNLSTTIIDGFTNTNFFKSMASNWGIGLDLGAHYKIFPNLETSVSLTNLGFINWRGLNLKAKIDGSYQFEGVEINSAYMFQDEYWTNYLKSVLDSVKYRFDNGPFIQGLYPRLYAGVLYSVAPELDIALISSTSFYRETVREDLTLSLNIKPVPNFSFSVGYNLFQKGYGNFDLGIGYKLLIFNSYFVIEGMPLMYDLFTVNSINYQGIKPRIPIPVNLYSLNLRFGLNLAFGNSFKKKKSV